MYRLRLAKRNRTFSASLIKQTKKYIYKKHSEKWKYFVFIFGESKKQKNRRHTTEIHFQSNMHSHNQKRKRVH